MTFVLKLLDIILVSLLFYYIYIFFRHDRAWQILRGILLCMIITILAAFLKLEVLEWILKNLWTVSILALIILFQPEIRAIFAEVGKNRFFFVTDLKKNILDILLDSIQILSKTRTGALIVLEKNDNLKSFIDTGIKLNSIISKELILTIFKNGTELHDGAIIILKNNKIASASSILPLTNKNFPNTTGTRHRAGIGMSEATDAIVIIVSEETGNISIAYNGNITWGVDLTYLKNFLYSLTNNNNDNKKNLFFKEIKNFFSLKNIKNNVNIKIVCLFFGFIFCFYTKYFVIK